MMTLETMITIGGVVFVLLANFAWLRTALNSFDETKANLDKLIIAHNKLAERVNQIDTALESHTNRGEWG